MLQEKTTQTTISLQGLGNWSLNVVSEELDCTMDNSGIYTVIHYTKTGIRVDIMSISDQPIISFISHNPNALRKTVIKWINDNAFIISAEHSSYIGYELSRCFSMQSEYIQD